MLNVKEGQTYICKRDDMENWTFGKEYKVVFDKGLGLVIVDDCGDNWYIPKDNLLNNWFKLKEKAFDLNNLTIAQLREYVDLLEDKENTAALLNDVIERMSN